MYRYQLANKHLSEIKGHIMRSTYRIHDEIDSDTKHHKSEERLI